MAKKYTNYRVVVTDSALPGGEYVVTRRSLHDNYTHVILVWPYAYIGREQPTYGPNISFTRSAQRARSLLLSMCVPEVEAVRIAQEIQPADKT